MGLPFPSIPDSNVKIRLSWLMMLAVLLASVSVGYGSYRSAFVEKSQQLDQTQSEIKNLSSDLKNLQTAIVGLSARFDQYVSDNNRRKGD